MNAVLIVFAVAIGAVVFGQDCPGGLSTGAEVVSGQYYYVCQGGQLAPAGCLDDSGSKVPIGSTFNSNTIQKSCVSDGGHLTVKATACVTDSGTVVQPGSQTDGTNAYYSCDPNGDSYMLTVQGCLIDGNKVAVNDRVISGDQVKLCEKTSNKDVTITSGGCVDNGQIIDIGTQFSDDTAFYHCKKDGDNAVKNPIGCVNDGKKVYDLDIFQKGDNYYRCRVRSDKVESDLWGCALVKEDGSIEPKSIACTWDSGSDPINYVNCCIEKGGNAVITQLYCLYTYQSGRIQVNEGCYRIFDNTAAGCKRQADGSLKMDTWDASDVSNSLASGLHQC